MSSGLEVGGRARVISKEKQEVESTRQESEIVADDDCQSSVLRRLP